MIPDERPPFSHRYGLADYPHLSRWCQAGGEDIVEELWRSRHSLWMDICATVPSHAMYVEPLFRCICPGSSPRREDQLRRCAERASQEDRLCDYCRQWCFVVDDSNGYHRMVDVYGAAT